MNKATFLLSAFLLISTSVVGQQTLERVLIGNEGNFGSGNATITAFDFATKTATDGVFLNANGVGLGDVVQSITEIDDQLYIVVNNSQKVVITNPDTFQQTGQITLGAGSSPREILPIGNNKAYITDLFGNHVLIVDLNTKTVLSDTIKVGRNPDQMLRVNDFVFVANNGFGADSTIFKVDITTHTVVDTIIVSRGPASMVLDNEGMLWVVATGYSGDFDDDFNLIPGTSRPGGVHKINPSTGQVVASIEVSSAGNDLAIVSETNNLYINSGGIRRVNLDDLEVVADTLIAGSFYSFNYDAVNNLFFTADAKSFTNAGEVRYYSEDGSLVGSFDSGIIPGDIHFDYEMSTSIAEESTHPVDNFELHQNYPNPFNPSTTISFSLSETGQVQLYVFNAAGQKIAQLVNERLSAGNHSVTFEASSISTGVYFYRLQTSQGIITKKMMLIK
ncbi:MAG: T9SS type A sorting domain-containing protein [Balneolaceae bacterium]|nr:T9SS type A sorting domain-containing protein [Balneolaceae bacterium]